MGQRSAQRPQCTQTSSSFTMMRPVCGSGSETKSACRDSRPERRAACAQILLRPVARDGQALHRTNIDAGVALDAAAAVKTVSMSQFRQR